MKTLLHKILLVCDFCQGMVAYESPNKEALPENWVETNLGGHFCPECRPRYIVPTEENLVGLEHPNYKRSPTHPTRLDIRGQ